MAFSTHTEARFNGWFSRKFQTNEAHYKASTTNQDRITAKRENAWARQAASRKLTTAQKIARLPATGAVRERAKLTARLASEKLPKMEKKSK
jgi:hypothetical protein